MEIRHDSIAVFQHEDLNVFVRVKGSDLDKAVVEAMKQNAVQELMAGRTPRLSRDLAQYFVCGWSGATVGGQPAAYSWALLESALPPAVVDALAKFVGAHVDVLKQQNS